MIRRISKKIMKSRILIFAMILSVFLSLTSVAVDSVHSNESANIKETVREIEVLERNLNNNINTLKEEEKTEPSINEDEENIYTLENEDSLTNEETVIDNNIIVDEEGNIVEDEVHQPFVGGGLLNFSANMRSNYEETHYIYNENELAAFLNGTLGNNNHEFILMNDIDMGGQGPFRGRWGAQAFTGRFASEEGSRYTISNLSLRGRGNANLEGFGGFDHGFIRTAGVGAIIENVTFDNIVYAEPFPFSAGGGWQRDTSHLGLIIGRVNDGGVVNISNVVVTNGAMTLGAFASPEVSSNVQQTETRIGGLIGTVGASANVVIANVSIDATIEMRRMGDSTSDRTNRGGGMVGESLGDLTITESEVNVDLTRNGTAGIFWIAGGVLGRRLSGNVEISEVVQNGNVEAFVHAGGIVGRSEGSGSLTLEKVTTFVPPEKESEEDSEPEGNTISVSNNTGDGSVGGLIGSAVTNTTITESENHSSVSLTLAANTTSNVDVGGLVGFGDGGIIINDSSNHGNLNLIQPTTVNNHVRMAGIVARTNSNVTLENVTNWGDITRPNQLNNAEGATTPTSPNAANNRLSSGILGSANVATGAVVRINNAVNHGDMPTLIKLSAGIAGRFTGAGEAHIANSINYGDINTFERAGGIVGRNELSNLTIDRCINYGKLNAENGNTTQNILGGIIGSSQTGANGSAAAVDTRNVTISNCANRGEIVSRSTGTGNWNGTGGIAGWIPNNGLVIRNTYNIGHVRSVGDSVSLGGIIGQIRIAGVSVRLENVYSIGPVTSAGVNTTNGNGIVGYRFPGNNTGADFLILENVYVSAFFTGNAISDMNSQVRITSTNVYVDTSTARTTDENRLQTVLTGVTPVTTAQLVSGGLAGLHGEPWMYGIAGMPGQRTLPYFAWQTGGKQQEQFFHEIYSTNEEDVTEGTNIVLSGITSFPLINEVDIDVKYSTEGFDYSKIRVFTPNNGGFPYSYLEEETEVRPIFGSAANIPSRSLTTGLISENDVVGFDLEAGHRIFFNLNGGVQTNDAPLAQIIPHNGFANVPEMEEREGFIFEGWTIELNGNVTHYLPGEDIKVTSGGTFNAKWIASTTDLTVAKKVTGPMGNLKQEFEFTIYFYDSDIERLPENTVFSYEGDTVGNFNNPAPSSGTLILEEDGSATFRLAAGQAIRLLEVPATGHVRVIETPDNIYRTSIVITDNVNEEVTINNNETEIIEMIPGDIDRTFTFINDRIQVPQTGIEIGNIGMVMILILVPLSALATFVFHVILKHRKRARVL